MKHVVGEKAVCVGSDKEDVGMTNYNTAVGLEIESVEVDESSVTITLEDGSSLVVSVRGGKMHVERVVNNACYEVGWRNSPFSDAEADLLWGYARARYGL